MAESSTQQAAAGRVKFTVTHYRQSQHTHEAFIKWIVEDHLPAAIPIFKKHGVLGYTLFVTPQAMNDPLKQSLQATRPTWDVADYDCVIEYTLPGPGTVGAIMSDPEWIEIVSDQEKWVDVPKALVSLGVATAYL
ncbi:hypothetical protein F4778DRAFT_352097 [Xylariomycetidae sp. FL2044]|nr:hypothetical protein F4778DRAFT_352097 [Xylariomycetidae sp. FL2044]